MNTRFTARRGFAAIGAAIAAGALALSVAPAAFANPVANPALPNVDERATLTIDLRVRDGLVNQTNPADNVGAPVEGVVFRAQRHPSIDLFTRDGWTAAQALATSGDFSAFTGVTAIYSAATGSNGNTVIDVSQPAAPAELIPTRGVGLYLVTPVSGPDDLDLGLPFLVALPQTNIDGTGWLTNVTVYPKVGIDALPPTKTVQGLGMVQVGDDIQWTITAPIASRPGEEITFFQLRDVLSEHLAPANQTAPALTPPARPDTAPVVRLFNSATDAADPTVSGTTLDVTPTWERPDWTFNFTGAALTAINNAPAGSVVQIVLHTRVLSIPDTGSITNTVFFYPNQSFRPVTPPADCPSDHPYYDYDCIPPVDRPRPPLPPTTTPAVRFGGIEIVKSSSDAAFNGSLSADFRLFRTEADALANVEANALEVTPVGATAAVRTFSTDPTTGRVSIDGLQLSDFRDGVEITNPANWVPLYLLEVRALDGHELLAQPVQVFVREHNGFTEIGVVNIPSNAGFRLPMTGGAGTAMIFAVGGLIAIAAVGFFVVNRKHAATEA